MNLHTSSIAFARFRIATALVLLVAGLSGCAAVIYNHGDWEMAPAVLLGLIPQALPPNTFSGQSVARILGWIWFGVPTAFVLFLLIAVWNGASV